MTRTLLAIAAIAAATLTASPVLAESTTCALPTSFATPDAVGRWQVVVDGVMGGRSSGARFLEGDALVFTGEIVTRGGGFSSMRHRLRPGDLGQSDAVALRVRTDGRPYHLTFRTDQVYWRSVSFQADIPATPPGEWADVVVPLSSLRATVFGEPVPVDMFHRDEVRQMGVILADGVDGPFRFELAAMNCVNPAGES